MAAKYDLYENPDPKKSGNKQALHARLVPTGKTTAKRLCELASRGNTFNPNEMQAMLECLTDAVVRELENGYVVELGEIGTLSLTLDCRPVMEKSEIRSASVNVKNMTLHTSKEMKNRLRNIHLERNSNGWQTKKVDEALLEQRLTEFFATNAVMRSPDYCRLRECKRCKGVEELNGLIAQGRLLRDGKAGSTVYLPVGGNFGR